MEPDLSDVHIVHMAKSARKTEPKTSDAPLSLTYLREWREFKGVTLEAAGETLGVKHGQLSRIERAVQPYSQRLLERAARLYGTSVWSLLFCPPGGSPEAVIKRFFDQLNGK